MQRATCTGIRIRSPTDARVIFHAVLLNILPMVTRRLDGEERGTISSGCVYVWEERSPHAELTGVGIERWTDGIRWGPSRVREGFLFYHEKNETHPQYLYTGGACGSSNRDSSHSILIKQTYTVFVDTSAGQRKWHLIAYFTEGSIERLKSVDDFPSLANLTVPPGKYKSARSGKGRPDYIFTNTLDSPQFPKLEYVPYAPRRSPSPLSAQSPQQSAYQFPLTQIDTGVQNRYPTLTPRSPSSPETRDILAPLAYLKNIPPPRRHPIDEKILKLFSPARVL